MSYEFQDEFIGRSYTVTQMKNDGADSSDKAAAKEKNRVAEIYDFSYEARVVLKGRFDINIMDHVYLEVYAIDGTLHYSSGEYIVIERTDEISSDFTTTLKLQKVSGNIGSHTEVYDNVASSSNYDEGYAYAYDSKAVATKPHSRNTTKGVDVVYLSGGSIGEQIVNAAMSHVGSPYLWGGNSYTTGIDCSHFVCKILAEFGWPLGYHYSGALRSVGKRVDRADVQPGDVMCYNGHVAFYVDSTHIVHARGKAYGVECTQCDPFTYHNGYVTIRRMLE